MAAIQIFFLLFFLNQIGLGLLSLRRLEKRRSVIARECALERSRNLGSGDPDCRCGAKLAPASQTAARPARDHRDGLGSGERGAMHFFF
jgi:hypothetical protein